MELLYLKFIVRIFILLLLVNGYLLYSHYNDAGKANADIQLAHSQEIEVINRPNGLYIRHHFIGLSDRRHEIVWPEKSSNRSCYLNEGTTCTRLNEKMSAFVEGEVDRQSIMYVIPKSESMDQSTMFEDVFATLDGVEVSSTLFHLVDEMDIGGMWVTGFKPIGEKKMDLIDYTLYRGEGTLSDLYWHENELPIVYNGDRLSVYSRQDKMDVVEIESIEEAVINIDGIHSTIIIDENNKGLKSNRILVSKTIDPGEVENHLLVNNIASRFIIPKNERLTAEVIASLLSLKGVGSEKSRKMFDVLVNHLTNEQLEQVRERLHLHYGNPVDATYVDKVFGDVTGYKISFISKNDNSEVDLYPFLLEDLREVYIAGKESEDVAVLLKDGKPLFPIKKVMRELGYEVSSTDQSLYIKNQSRSFRFPIKEPFYVYNEQRYNVTSIPFEQIGDEFYFEESIFIRIFLVEIKKTAEVVEILPIATEGEAN